MSGSGRNPGDQTPPDIQAALERLEQAVQRIAATAKREFADRAASFIHETAEKLELEFGDERASRSHSPASRGSGRGSRRRRARHRRRNSGSTTPRRHLDRSRTGKLYRDPQRARIAGVCAGIANYFGAEVWVARCLAITGLIFMPSIVFPAYWILYFVMSPRPHKANPSEAAVADDRSDHTSPAPELGAKLSPRRSLFNLRADLSQAELRLRRIETHVTSGRYELQRELNKLDGDSAGVQG